MTIEETKTTTAEPAKTEPEKTPAPAPEPAKDSGLDALKSELEALKKAQAAKDKELDGYKQKEQQEAEKLKTDEQKRLEAENRSKALERENLILRLASKKGLDADLFNRVQGDSEEEINADIDLLLSKFAPPEAKEDPKVVVSSKTQPAKVSGEDRKDSSLPVHLDHKQFMSWRSEQLNKKA